MSDETHAGRYDDAGGLRDAMRTRVWTELRKVAHPDSRFHWDFSQFIADYEGSEEGAQRIRSLPAWQNSRLLFITPDNNLEPVRRLAIEDGKPFVMSTYGIGRGFLFLHPESVPAEKRHWAATLDGMERFARPVSLHEVRDLGRFNLLITGASAISTQGVRMGKGHGYFDLEWAMFSETGCVDDNAVVIGAGHDCQVVDADLAANDLDTRVDIIVTPTRSIDIPQGQGHRPTRVVWDRLAPDVETTIPPLRELRSWID